MLQHASNNNYRNVCPQVSTWLKNKVSQRGPGAAENGGPTMHIMKGALLEKLVMKGYNSSQLNVILAKVPGSHSDFRSDFCGGKKEHSIKIPRCHINEEILTKIDSCELFSLQ
jgi:hypothetical protein